jgi:hypothetical protein
LIENFLASCRCPQSSFWQSQISVQSLITHQDQELYASIRPHFLLQDLQFCSLGLSLLLFPFLQAVMKQQGVFSLSI